MTSLRVLERPETGTRRITPVFGLFMYHLARRMSRLSQKLRGRIAKIEEEEKPQDAC